VPVPGEGEVLIRVRAAGINAIDWATRKGQGVDIPAFPAVLGWDVSGTVAALGPG
jgi:NADPH:quinone reductase-like Zn-dependent oxidoreductase